VNSWRIEFLPSARRDFSRLPHDVRADIANALDRLQWELSHPSEPRLSDVKALQGAEKGEFRPRVRKYRVRYRLEDERLVVQVIRVGHRSDVYRG